MSSARNVALKIEQKDALARDYISLMEQSSIYDVHFLCFGLLDCKDSSVKICHSRGIINIKVKIPKLVKGAYMLYST